MSGAAPTHISSSSGPLLSGTPSFIPYFETLVENYKDMVALAIQNVAQEEKDAMKASAMSSDTGWKDLADNLDVSFNYSERDFEYSFNGDRDAVTKAQSLEFGDEKNAASPLIRRSMARSKQTLSSRVMTKTHDLLFGGNK